MKCEDCMEWEYFDGYGYGCFCMKTMIPIDADKCEFYTDKRSNVSQSKKSTKTLLENVAEWNRAIEKN